MKNDLFLPNTEHKEAVRSILSSLGILCAAVTVLVFSALFFADITLSVSGALDFTVDFALLFFSSYIMYFSLFDTGAEKAALLPEHSSLTAERERLFLRYRTDGSSESLSAFCTALSKEKTEEKKELFLSHCCTTEAEISKIKEKAPKERRFAERRILWRFEHLKSVRITPRMLLAERTVATLSIPLLSTPEKMRRQRFFRFLLPTALTALLSVSLACEVIRNPSADVIVGYLLKLFTLLFNGVKGFRSGYAFVACDKSAYMREQCFWLEEYFASLERQSASPPPPSTKE